MGDGCKRDVTAARHHAGRAWRLGPDDRGTDRGEIAAADGLLASIGGERLYAICLQTAYDGMSVAFCANTEEGYAEKRASEAEFEEMTSEYESYLRWAPAE